MEHKHIAAGTNFLGAQNAYIIDPLTWTTTETEMWDELSFLSYNIIS